MEKRKKCRYKFTNTKIDRKYNIIKIVNYIYNISFNVKNVRLYYPIFKLLDDIIAIMVSIAHTQSIYYIIIACLYREWYMI